MSEGIMLHRSRGKFPKYTYTGDHEFIDDGDGNWRIKFKSSGTLTFLQPNNARKGIDAFLVGGGGGGACAYAYTKSYVSFGSLAGGGSGYTKTQKNIPVQRRTEYQIVVGSGGNYSHVYGANSASATASAGTASTAFGYSAAGGTGGKASHNLSGTGSGSATGGSGGSGAYSAAAVTPEHYNNRAGATDGANGTGSSKGQGTTTREFGDDTGDLYAQGGGSGNGTPQTDNTGNGGNAGYTPGSGTSLTRLTTSGCSGIVIIRNHRE